MSLRFYRVSAPCVLLCPFRTCVAIEGHGVEPHQNDRIVVALRHAARELTRRRDITDLEQTLGRIVISAVATVPGIDAGSISMTRRGQIETRQPTSETIGRLDSLQSALHEGPCITAIEGPPESGVVIAHDFAAPEVAERWPRFAPHAVAAGYRALISTQISVDSPGGPRGALNLYSTSPNTIDEHTRTIAGLFGVQAALLLYGSDTAAHLNRAVDNRDLIGQAKGVLMERFKADDTTAFHMLVKASQDTNLKLTTVALWVTGSVSQDGTAEDRVTGMGTSKEDS
ncbi:hypothetical protein GCM10009629_41960 [Pseudonocardia alni]